VVDIVMPGMVSAVYPMITVREQVDDRAQAEKHVRQHAEDMSSVLFPQEEEADGQEETEPQPHWKTKRLASCIRLGCSLHGILLES
jgi:hypothetical protein